jgi:hypothetical protein
VGSVDVSHSQRPAVDVEWGSMDAFKANEGGVGRREEEKSTHSE